MAWGSYPPLTSHTSPQSWAVLAGGCVGMPSLAHLGLLLLSLAFSSHCRPGGSGHFCLLLLEPQVQFSLSFFVLSLYIYIYIYTHISFSFSIPLSLSLSLYSSLSLSLSLFLSLSLSLFSFSFSLTLYLYISFSSLWASFSRNLIAKLRHSILPKNEALNKGPPIQRQGDECGLCWAMWKPQRLRNMGPSLHLCRPPQSQTSQKPQKCTLIKSVGKCLDTQEEWPKRPWSCLMKRANPPLLRDTCRMNPLALCFMGSRITAASIPLHPPPQQGLMILQGSWHGQVLLFGGMASHDIYSLHTFKKGSRPFLVSLSQSFYCLEALEGNFTLHP